MSEPIIALATAIIAGLLLQQGFLMTADALLGPDVRAIEKG